MGTECRLLDWPVIERTAALRVHKNKMKKKKAMNYNAKNNNWKS